MAVISVSELLRERHSEEDWTGRKHTRSFLVKCDKATDGTATAINAAGVPRLKDTYIGVDEWSWVVEKDGRPYEDQPDVFIVLVNYVSYVRGGIFELAQNPINRPPKVRFANIVTAAPMQIDRDGKLVANSAGVPFDPPITRDVTRFSIIFTHNEGRFWPAIARDFKDAINSDIFLDVAPGHVKIGGIEADYMQEGAYQFWTVTYTFQFNFDSGGFEPKTVDQGFQELQSIFSDANMTNVLVEMVSPVFGYKKKPNGEYQIIDGSLILDPKATGYATVSSPQLLNGHGRRIPPPVNPDDTIEAVELQFRRYNTMSFRRLGIEPIIRKALLCKL